MSPAQKPNAGVGGLAGPTTIRRNTSFSQRLHSFLHRDKSQKQQHPSAAATAATPPQSRRTLLGVDSPSIAYRTPTIQTQNTDRSDISNPPSGTSSPPHEISPQATSSKDSLPKAYHAQRNFEPVPASQVFAVTNTNLRSVNHAYQQQRKHSTTATSTEETLVHVHKHAVASGTCATGAADAAAAAIDDITDGLRQTDIEHTGKSRDSSVHKVSREPSQTTLHQNQSAADIHADTSTAAAKNTVSATPVSSSAAASRHPVNGANARCAENGNESKLAGRTLSSKIADDAAADLKLRPVPERELASHPSHPPSAGAAGAAAQPPDMCTPKKKPGPVYSSHNASLNQFGRQTKVIGKGTGGTVRLLQSGDVNTRPPSLRSGPPSSHHGEELNSYTPSEHRLFAVKEFRKRRQDETPRSYMKKVTSEFCIGSSIHHENVIETLDLIFEGERVYEIMEYCPHDLFTFVAMGDMDLDETFCWFKQVCQGVHYLHKIGIAHRDLKLENCLLTERGIVKIIDFGCATVFKTPFQKEPSKVVGVCGSDPYIAPEVLHSKRQLPYYPHTADIWSVGIMYMCMTLLKFPWRIADIENDRNYGSYIRDWPRGRERLFAQLPTLRHDGQKVIEGMVYPDAAKRFTMEQVMESEWIKEIDVCHAACPSKSHTHRMKTE
ncbi:serine/threonine protein kinase [Dipsacomyces acuminosporus]|nr:serine/threonine protein kinase [Dipsacomyces acuminosporus]